ncbi:MAG: hypothetical protein WCK42_08775 [Myxococcaceae bacterium]
MGQLLTKGKVDLGTVFIDAALGVFPGAGKALGWLGKKLGLVATKSASQALTNSLRKCVINGSIEGAINGGTIGFLGGTANSLYTNYKETGDINWNKAMGDGLFALPSGAMGGAIFGAGTKVILSKFQVYKVSNSTKKFESQESRHPLKKMSIKQQILQKSGLPTEQLKKELEQLLETKYGKPPTEAKELTQWTFKNLRKIDQILSSIDSSSNDLSNLNQALAQHRGKVYDSFLEARLKVARGIEEPQALLKWAKQTEQIGRKFHAMQPGSYYYKDYSIGIKFQDPLTTFLMTKCEKMMQLVKSGQLQETDLLSRSPLKRNIAAYLSIIDKYANESTAMNAVFKLRLILHSMPRFIRQERFSGKKIQGNQSLVEQIIVQRADPSPQLCTGVRTGIEALPIKLQKLFKRFRIKVIINGPNTKTDDLAFKNRRVCISENGFDKSFGADLNSAYQNAALHESGHALSEMLYLLRYVRRLNKANSLTEFHAILNKIKEPKESNWCSVHLSNSRFFREAHTKDVQVLSPQKLKELSYYVKCAGEEVQGSNAVRRGRDEVFAEAMNVLYRNDESYISRNDFQHSIQALEQYLSRRFH